MASVVSLSPNEHRSIELPANGASTELVLHSDADLVRYDVQTSNDQMCWSSPISSGRLEAGVERSVPLELPEQVRAIRVLLARIHGDHEAATVSLAVI